MRLDLPRLPQPSRVGLGVVTSVKRIARHWMGISLDKSGTGVVISLAGVIDIACAAELKALLLDALTSGMDVLISLDDATDLDVTAFQLLWAAERQARQSALEFRVSGQVPNAISIALAQAGFQPFSTLVHAG